MKILFFCDDTHNTGAVSDHINAITKTSHHQWHIENPLSCKVLHKLDFNLFDAIGFHYSIRPNRSYHCPKVLFDKVRSFRGIKFQFLQDENYRSNDMMESLAQLGIDVLFTIVRPELVHQAYPGLKKTKFVTVLTGYVPDNLKHIETPPIDERPIDIFYRSRTCPYWLGQLAQDKIRIAQGVRQLAKDHGLKVDLSVREEDRIYGAEWVRRLSGAKAVLGTESGASIYDFTGEIEKKTNHYLVKNPRASFEEVHQNILVPYENNLIYSALSPRVFEAAALKTPMIMFPGWYSGVCKPGEHYIVLEKDFSNFPEVVRQLKDSKGLQQLADRTYEDLILSGNYKQSILSKAVDQALESCMKTQLPLACTQDIAAFSKHVKAKYTILNMFLLAVAEFKFIITNFLRILFDRTYPRSHLIKKLYNGASLYFLLLKPRFKRPKLLN